MLSEVIIILLLILANGVFSLAEIALVTSRRSRLEAMAKRGDANSKLALKISQDPSRLLSTVQVGITLIGILTGAFSGREITARLTQFLSGFELVQPYADTIAFSIVIIIITFFSLIIGELVPKQISISNPERIARVMARPMNFISSLGGPFVYLLSATTNSIVKLFNIKPVNENAYTEEEIISMVAHGTTSGDIEEVEQDIISRVFQLGDRVVGSLMTNRIDLEWLDVNDSFETNRERILESSYSSFPLCDDTIDNVIGIVYTKQFLISMHDEDEFDLRTISAKPIFIPENMTAFRALEKFKEAQSRVAIVVDEFGAVQGMMTMTDIIEALIGELDNPANEEELQIVEREDGTYLIDALISFEEFINYFEIESVEAEDRTGFHTLGGFILHLNEQIPHTGEIFTWRDFSFEVIDMDNNRIDKILVKKGTTSAGNE